MLQQPVTLGHSPGVHVGRLKISGKLSVNCEQSRTRMFDKITGAQRHRNFSHFSHS
jgi:hypothetical protein